MPQKKRFGDRYDGRRVRKAHPMEIISPYLMKDRSGCQNLFKNEIDMSYIDEYLLKKKEQGFKGISIMHVIIASYIRAVSQYPGINRFISGQRIYKRDEIILTMTVKQEMSIDSPDTVLKLKFKPDATIDNVYYTFEKAIGEYRDNPNEAGIDDVMGVLSRFPGLFLRFIVGVLSFLDYFGIMPKSLIEVSPFHSSMYITSLGSLGIPAVYHHLYNFGNVPIFLAFGAKKRRNELGDDGSVVKKTYIDLTFVLDERICDGYYFASAYKYMRKLLKDPAVLDNKPEKIVQDIE